MTWAVLEDVDLVEVEVVVGGAEHLGPREGAVVGDGAAAVVVRTGLRVRVLEKKICSFIRPLWPSRPFQRLKVQFHVMAPAGAMRTVIEQVCFN